MVLNHVSNHRECISLRKLLLVVDDIIYYSTYYSSSQIELLKQHFMGRLKMSKTQQITIFARFPISDYRGVKSRILNKSLLSAVLQLIAPLKSYNRSCIYCEVDKLSSGSQW